ncbi:MAG: acyl-CoA dehydrogenase family protein [Sphingomonadaceae bacterium]|nr:acyl-CoA dehydrogenase family protein [Sphingomonadaceae bacterium]
MNVARFIVTQNVRPEGKFPMYLVPEGDELEIANAAAEFIASALPINRLHTAGNADMNGAVRSQLAEMGWFALALPEDKGGSGLTAVEHALFFREIGRQCGPVDILAQALAAMVCKSADVRDALVSGTASAAVLVPEGNRHRLIGSASATHGLLVTPQSASLHEMAQANIEARPALDPANSLALVENLPAPAESQDGAHIWRLGQIGSAAMQVGLAEAALDLIVEYAKVRETFGKAIGSWQAVRHTCADMAVMTEAARAELWYAATAMKEDRGDMEAHVDAAKHLANEAALKATDSNIQLHGGIGVTDEHDAHLLMKHAALLSRLFGSRQYLLSRLLHAKLED